MGLLYGSGIKLELTIGFESNAPLDNRVVVQDISSLNDIQYTYTGLLTYVKESNTLYVYDNSSWGPLTTGVNDIASNEDIIKLKDDIHTIDEGVSAALVDLNKKIVNNSSYINIIDNSINNINANISTLNSSIINIDYVNSSILNDISILKNDIHTIDEGVSAALVDLNKKIINVSAYITNIDSSINYIINIDDSLLNDISILQNNTKILDGSINSINSSILNIINQNTSILKDISILYNDVSTALVDLSGNITDINKAINDISELKNDIHTIDEGVKTSLADLNKKIINVSTYTNIIDNSINNINSSISNIINQNTSILNDISILYNDVSTSLVELEEYIEDISTLVNNINNLNIEFSSDISSLQNDVSILDEAVSAALIDLHDNIVDISNNMVNANNIEAITIYTPNDAIPDDYKSNPIGYLSSMDASTLKTMTFSQILDNILFQDFDAEIIYNENNNSITYPSTIELNSIIDANSFILKNATVSCKYINGKNATFDWTNNGLSDLLKTDANVLGTISKCITSTFSFTPPENTVLTTAMGKPTSILLEEKTSVKYGSVTTYVKIYYMIGKGINNTLNNDIELTFKNTDISTNIKKFTLLTSLSATSGTANYVQYGNSDVSTSRYLLCGTWGSSGLTNSSYVYVLLPNILKINKVYIRNGVSGTADETKNFDILGNSQLLLAELTVDENSKNVNINSISTLNKYNIWYIAKSGFNSNNTVTANDEPIKIQIVKI